MRRIVATLTILAVLLIPAAAYALSSVPDSIVVSGEDVHVAKDKEVTSVVVIGGSATIEGRVTDAVVAIAGSIYLKPGAIVDGDVVAVGGTVHKEGDARVGGEQVSLGIPSLQNMKFGRLPLGLLGGNWFSFSFSVWRILAVIFLGWMTYWLFPRHSNEVMSAISADPAKSVLFGLLGYLALLPLTIILIITLLGIPLVPLLWLAVAAGRFLGQVALGLLVGRYLAVRLNFQVSDIYHTLLGLFALGAVVALPVVGGIASLFYGLVGFGAVIWTRFGTKPVPAVKE